MSSLRLALKASMEDSSTGKSSVPSPIVDVLAELKKQKRLQKQQQKEQKKDDIKKERSASESANEDGGVGGHQQQHQHVVKKKKKETVPSVIVSSDRKGIENEVVAAVSDIVQGLIDDHEPNPLTADVDDTQEVAIKVERVEDIDESEQQEISDPVDVLEEEPQSASKSRKTHKKEGKIKKRKLSESSDNSSKPLIEEDNHSKEDHTQDVEIVHDDSNLKDTDGYDQIENKEVYEEIETSETNDAQIDLNAISINMSAIKETSPKDAEAVGTGCSTGKVKKKRKSSIAILEEEAHLNLSDDEGDRERKTRRNSKGNNDKENESAATVATPAAVTVSPRGKVGKGKGAGAKARAASITETEPQPTVVVQPAETFTWACCDDCGKWRKLPSIVSSDSLPDQWYCHMNAWDDKHNKCEDEEEPYTESSATVADETQPQEQQHQQQTKQDRHTRGTPRISKKKTNTDYDSGNELDLHPRKRVAKSAPSAPSANNDASSAAVDATDWVQCNRCNKWRKVPSTVVDSLPDAWYCSMNVWAPAFSRCSVKEEIYEQPSEADQQGNDDQKPTKRNLPRRKQQQDDQNNDQKESQKGSEQQTSKLVVSSNGSVKKVTQWVQCERRNCKKWRKLPAHVDLNSLPEKWYCELNFWDPERASCEGPEESDSDGDAQHAGARSQLIIGNSKGPSSLSYRRLIFGTDGKIRPAYNEKSKNGFGLFSYTESFKPSSSDELVPEAIRKIGYWWSSAFDESKLPTPSSLPLKKKPVVEVENQAPPPVEKMCVSEGSVFREAQPHYLIDMIQQSTSNISLDPPRGSKWKHDVRDRNSLGLFKRVVLTNKLVYACLLTPPVVKKTLNEVMRLICNTFFHDRDIEVCRATLGYGELKQTIHRLEEEGLVEVTINDAGELCISVCSVLPEGTVANPYPDLVSSSDKHMMGKSLPLKMRKRKFTFVEKKVEKEKETFVSPRGRRGGRGGGGAGRGAGRQKRNDDVPVPIRSSRRLRQTGQDNSSSSSDSSSEDEEKAEEKQSTAVEDDRAEQEDAAEGGEEEKNEEEVEAEKEEDEEEGQQGDDDEDEE